MQKIEYTCDWCYMVMPAERANRFSFSPVLVPHGSTPPSGEIGQKFEKAEQILNVLMDHRERALNADICDACSTQLREWIESRRRK